MTRLTIRHETRYTYERPVSFGEHKLLMRPRDGHSLRLIDASLQLSPGGASRWVYDALGNCVCYFSPRGAADSLTIISNLTIDRYPAMLSPQIDDPHAALPIGYSLADRLVLAPMLNPATEDADAAVSSWVRGFAGHPTEPVLFLLQRLNNAIHQTFEYRLRNEPGVQAPADTIGLRSGTCRDFAWLMVEALRRLGIAARFVTGYLYSANANVRGAGATHAWCEVFLPGQGWTEFDPTNGLAESPDLIAVAVARTPAEAVPLCGEVIGDPGYCHMEVDVRVDLVDAHAAHASQAAA